jgi:hypothetical protein
VWWVGWWQGRAFLNRRSRRPEAVPGQRPPHQRRAANQQRNRLVLFYRTIGPAVLDTYFPNFTSISRGFFVTFVSLSRHRSRLAFFLFLFLGVWGGRLGGARVAWRGQSALTHNRSVPEFSSYLLPVRYACAHVKLFSLSMCNGQVSLVATIPVLPVAAVQRAEISYPSKLTHD